MAYNLLLILKRMHTALSMAAIFCVPIDICYNTRPMAIFSLLNKIFCCSSAVDHSCNLMRQMSKLTSPKTNFEPTEPFGFLFNVTHKSWSETHHRHSQMFTIGSYVDGRVRNSYTISADRPSLTTIAKSIRIGYTAERTCVCYVCCVTEERATIR